MKKIILSFIIILVASCTGTDSATHIITVDVLKQYPEKNILVKNIAEIELDSGALASPFRDGGFQAQACDGPVGLEPG